MSFFNNEKKKQNKKGLLTAKIPLFRSPFLHMVFVVITIFLIVSYLYLTWIQYQKTASSEAVVLSQSLESILPSEHIARFSGNAKDLDKLDYVMFKKTLMQLTETSNSIVFAYILGEHNGSMIFLVDSETAGFP